MENIRMRIMKAFRRVNTASFDRYLEIHLVVQSELIAEACLDRIVHKSKRFELKGESLRKKY